MLKEINYDILLKRINERKNNLNKIANSLKKKFVGIDHIIDSVIENINIWYVMPELITRPTIINLWGMTGVGKTDLIRSLVKELKFSDKFLEIQLTNKGTLYHDSIQTYLANSAIEYDDPGVLLLDEVQRFRTVDEFGAEIHDCKFQDLWMLLSDGCFSNNARSKSELLELLFGDKFFEEEEEIVSSKDEIEASEKRKKRKYHRSFYSATQLKKQLKLSEPVEQIMTWTEEKKISLVAKALNSCTTYEGDSYRKLLIFISGNLDEAYDMAKETGNADFSADVFHDFSSKINLIDIKEALNRRFKPEQISRLGNVHIIYPSLSKKNYEILIQRKINEIVNNVKKEYGIKIKVDKTVNKCIYRNGVFPTQGVRPVFSSVYALLGTSIPTFVLQSIESKEFNIELTYVNNNLIAKIGNQEVIYDIECSIDKIKNDDNKSQKALFSVHEAGHAIVYASLFKASPTQITSSTSAGDNSGFIGLHKINASKEDIYNKIITFMAGLTAEKIVFGHDHSTAGAGGDIEQATKLASKYYRDWAFGDSNAKIVNPYKDPCCPGNYNIGETNSLIESLVKKGKKEAENIIKENLDFFKAVIDVLVEKGQIKPQEFSLLAKKFGLDVKIVPPKNTILADYNLKLEKFKTREI